MTNDPTTPVSVIIPALNEEDTIAGLLDALFAGTRPPDEIVVADGGSTDSTRDIVTAYAGRGVRLIDGPGGISENRNAAIEAASHDVIACTDAGCIPDPTWLERLTHPFEEGALWTGGLSRPARDSRIQSVIGLAMMPATEEIDLRHFVPGGASQAFRREVWQRAGGFPEGLSAGEDTLFGRRVRDLGIDPVVVPQAQVAWQAPKSLSEMARKAYLWGRADGTVGTNSTSYLRLVLVWVGGLAAGILLPILQLPRLGLAALGTVLGASAWMTRRKHRAIGDVTASISLPAIHAVRVTSQSIGWLGGYLGREDRASAPRLALTIGSRLTRKAKRTIRRHLPDSLVARLRSHPGSSPTRTSRNNVDILVSDASEVARWLESTPDTYRVGLEPTPPATTGVDVITRPEHVSSDVKDRLAAAIERGVDAAALATTTPPAVRSEPTIDPIAVAVRRGALEVTIPSDTSTLQHLVGQAGLHQAVIPISGLEPAPSRRPIGDPGAVVIFGTVPMYDVGGGSRGAQMAHELVARGYHVTYLNLFGSDEQIDLGLRYVHPNLDEIPAERFDLDRYLGRLATGRRAGILELPHPGYREAIERLQAAGFSVAYDLMDDWSDPALGAWGYTNSLEAELAERCDALVASAPSLVRRLTELSKRDVTLVPNAVNTRLFRPKAEFALPDDMPAGDGPVLEYHGSLYGDWFDWTALERTAVEHPGARLVIIGDDRNHPRMPENVHFLGLKPQYLLPAYLAHSDVAIIPFELSETTHAVSPLKVFEYLAMEVPVASVPLDPVKDLDGVYTDEDLSTAVDAALAADRPDGSAVATAHGWGERMSRIFFALGLDLVDDADATPIHVTQRPVTHWPPDRRRL
ncbi:MAG TPA: glycosyltransferase [Acidimicrobiia bacterium]